MVAYQDMMSSSHISELSFSTSDGFNEPESVAEFLFKEVRVLCLVLSNVQGLKERAPTIINTWGRRCHKIVFISDDLGLLK